MFEGIALTVAYLSFSHVVLSDTFLGPSYRPFWADGICSLRGQGCVVGPGGRSVLTLLGFPGPYPLDMSNNYWGTADLDRVAEMIWDGTDDHGIGGVVSFQPIANGSLPTEKKSLGSIKSMFR
jgi:hypothetical protein